MGLGILEEVNYGGLVIYYTDDIHLACHCRLAYHCGCVLSDAVALNPGQNQPLRQDNAQLVQILQTQMGPFIAEVVLLLLPLQQTDQRSLLRHLGVQEVRDHHPQNLQVVIV